MRMSGSTLNVILFGETGSGKSSLINLIAGQPVAKVSSGAGGCTMSFQRYPFIVNGRSVQIWDTTGLDEPNMEVEAIGQAFKLIHDWNAYGGVDLLLFCIRAPRITATSQVNYRLFYEGLCRSRVPIALAMTNLEQESDMEDWWTRNGAQFKKFGLTFAAHVCITGLPDHDKYIESRKRVWDLLQAHCGERFTMAYEAWATGFAESLSLFTVLPSLKGGLWRKRMVLDLKRFGMEQKKAEEVADRLEKLKKEKNSLTPSDIAAAGIETV